jgi:uncharacterized protein involved in type VI secretion and phage assembly
MRRQSGVVIGIVKSLDDPREEGRIQVEYPWLGEGQRSGWAPVAVPLSGGGRGMYFMPEPEDEVLVAFEHGDFNHPFIVGFLWNGQDSPPESDRKNRVIVTPGGHTLRFEDDEAAKKVIIQSDGGQRVELKDQPATITVETSNGNKIEITDTPAGVAISVPQGQVSVDCLQASVNASTILRVTAPVAQFSGVVQAQAVISNSYNPAPGNTYGA